MEREELVAIMPNSLSDWRGKSLGPGPLLFYGYLAGPQGTDSLLSFLIP